MEVELAALVESERRFVDCKYSFSDEKEVDISAVCERLKRIGA